MKKRCPRCNSTKLRKTTIKSYNKPLNVFWCQDCCAEVEVKHGQK